MPVLTKQNTEAENWFADFVKMCECIHFQSPNQYLVFVLIQTGTVKRVTLKIGILGVEMCVCVESVREGPCDRRHTCSVPVNTNLHNETVL